MKPFSSSGHLNDGSCHGDARRAAVIGRLSDDVGPRRTVVRTCNAWHVICMARVVAIFSSLCAIACMPIFQRFRDITVLIKNGEFFYTLPVLKSKTPFGGPYTCGKMGLYHVICMHVIYTRGEMGLYQIMAKF